MQIACYKLASFVGGNCDDSTPGLGLERSAQLCQSTVIKLTSSTTQDTQCITNIRNAFKHLNKHHRLATAFSSCQPNAFLLLSIDKLFIINNVELLI